MDQKVKNAILTLGIKCNSNHPPKIKLIQKQYHILCMTYHPDRPGGNSEKTKQITEAYRLIGEFIEENYNQYNDDHEEVIARAAFKQFNFSDVKENLRSYTIKIENHLSHFWDQVLSNHYSDPPLTYKTMTGIGRMSTLLMVIQTVTSPWASGTALGETISQKYWFRVVVEGTSWLSALLSEVSSMAKSVPQLQEEAPIVEYSCKSGY